jgi:hypothetical protein
MYDSTFHQITGFFEAPVDGEYQFHMTCYANCQFYMSLDDPMNNDRSQMTTVISSSRWRWFREYGTHDFNDDVDASDFEDVMFS